MQLYIFRQASYNFSVNRKIRIRRRCDKCIVFGEPVRSNFRHRTLISRCAFTRKRQQQLEKFIWCHLKMFAEAVISIVGTQRIDMPMVFRLVFSEKCLDAFGYDHSAERNENFGLKREKILIGKRRDDAVNMIDECLMMQI